jgi:hypothetical protein
MEHTVQSLAEQLTRHVETCEAQSAANGALLKSLVDGQMIGQEWRDNFNAMAWKAVGAVALAILAGAVTLGVQAISLHADTHQVVQDGIQAAAKSHVDIANVDARLKKLEAGQ